MSDSFLTALVSSLDNYKCLLQQSEHSSEVSFDLKTINRDCMWQQSSVHAVYSYHSHYYQEYIIIKYHERVDQTCLRVAWNMCLSLTIMIDII